MVGRTPRSAADAPVGLLAPGKMLIPLFRLRDAGVPRGPGGPPGVRPTTLGRIRGFEESKWHWASACQSEQSSDRFLSLFLPAFPAPGRNFAWPYRLPQRY